MTGTVDAFRAAAEVAAAILTSGPVADAWDEPSAVEGFTVGALAAHLLTATARTEQVLDEPEPVGAQLVDVAAFYGANRLDDRADAERGLHPMIRAAAADQAAKGPASVGAEFTDLVTRLGPRLAMERADRLVGVLQVPGGATPLSTYLATRVVELVVHVDDLAASVGLPDTEVPAPAADAVIGVFVELARSRSGDLAVVRAFARRERAGADILRVL